MKKITEISNGIINIDNHIVDIDNIASISPVGSIRSILESNPGLANVGFTIHLKQGDNIEITDFGAVSRYKELEKELIELHKKLADFWAFNAGLYFKH